ncbi:MAG: preprotein translocase subunit SecG [Clostridia bacterium]|jgi:preprotein translocase subunit SecG|nr:preprotein translocase subunit SecG [Clostridia bacterium]
MNLSSLISNLLIPAKNEAMYTTYRTVSIVLIICMGVAAIAAIILVMLQPGNSQGIDALGGSSETFYGKNKGKSTEAKLKLATIICLVILAVFAIVFFIVQIDAIWA